MIDTGRDRLDPEERLLVSLCRRDFELVPGDWNDPERAARIRRRAHGQRVLGLALDALREHARWSELSPAVADALLSPAADTPARGGERRTFEELCTRARDQQGELARLLERLGREGLEPLVLKGPALRATVYPRPVQRRLADFDLLFSPDQVDRALGVAAEAGYAFPFSAEQLDGYRRHHFHVLLRSERRFRTEIHWELSDPDGPVRLDPEAFRRGAREVPLESGGRLWVPAAEHVLLHMAHEHVRDSCSRLVRIVDADRIASAHPQLDWDTVLAEARRGGLEVLLALTVELARDLLGAPIPDEVRRSLRPGAGTRLHLTLMRPAPAMLRGSLARAPFDLAFALWSAPGPRRGRLLARMLGGRRWAKQWIFRERAGPPGRWQTALVGLKSGAGLIAAHVRLYGRALRRSPSRAA